MEQLLLSIETATEVCSVSMHRGQDLLAAAELHTPYSHSEKLTLLIEDLFKRTDAHRSELAAVAVSAGPGSYTGLRIGTSTAKSICFGLDIPLIAVPTLEAMAAEAIAIVDASTHVMFAPMLDARRMEVYYALYDTKLNCLQTATPKVIEQHAFQHEIETGSLLYLLGSGAAKCSGFIGHHPHAIIHGMYPKAKWIGERALTRMCNQEFVDVSYFEPEYLKPYKAKKPQRDKLLGG